MFAQALICNPAELHFTQARLHRLSVVALGLAASLANGEPIPARPADAFVDSIGVNTHFNFRTTAYYQRFEDCKKAILDADIRHVRGQALNEKNNADVIKLQKSLAECGVKFCLVFFNHYTPISGN